MPSFSHYQMNYPLPPTYPTNHVFEPRPFARALRGIFGCPNSNKTPPDIPSPSPSAALGDSPARWSRQASPRSTPSVSPQEDTSPPVTMGFVLFDQSAGTVVFGCHMEGCAGRTFKRHHELKRHHEAYHSVCRKTFWCVVPACPRSREGGERPFCRADKCAEHLRRQHNIFEY